MEIENHKEEVPFAYYEEKFLTFSPEEIREMLQSWTEPAEETEKE